MTSPIVTKMWSQDVVSFSLDTRNGQRRATIIEGYQITAPPTFTHVQIAQLPQLPVTGMAYPGVPDTWLVDREIVRRSPIYWEARLSYQGEFPSIDMRPVRRWGRAATTESIDEDINGNPIVTVNGEPLDGLTKDISDPVLTVRKNFREINIAAIHQYFDSVNADTFAGFAPGTARFLDFAADEETDGNNTRFWRVSVQFQFRYPYRTTPERAWWKRVRHEGYFRNVGGNIRKCVDSDGEPLSRPALLNLDGTQRTETDQADWLEWQVYTPVPYNSLGLLI